MATDKLKLLESNKSPGSMPGAWTDDSLTGSTLEGISALREEAPPDTNEAPPHFVGAAGQNVFAYLICIDNYEKIPTLRACIHDGEEFAKFLTKKFSHRPLRIERLYNGDATHDRILSLLERASSCENNPIQKGDLVILFYAGHGSQTRGPPGWSEEIEVLCPYDINTSKNGTNIYGIPDFVLGTLVGRLAKEREANVLLVFDCCHAAGMPRNETSAPRSSVSDPIPEPVLVELFSKYSEAGKGGSLSDENSPAPFTFLAASGKMEVACEYLENSWEGAFTKALISQLGNEELPWHNLSYAALCKSLPKLPSQTPECVGESDRIVFSLNRAEHDGLYFDVEPINDTTYTVKDAGLALGIRVHTKFIIRDPAAQDLGTLIVEDVEASYCRARAELSESHQGGIPKGAKAFLHHWCLGDTPLQVALQPGIKRPDVSNSVRIIDHWETDWEKDSKMDVVVAQSGDKLELIRRKDSYIARTTEVHKLDLPNTDDAATDGVTLKNILESVARFHHHLLRKGPGRVNPSIIMEICQVEPGEDGRYRMNKASSRVMEDRVNIHSRLGARYGMIIRNTSGHTLYPYLFYFDPSGYSIQSIYPPTHQKSSPLSPNGVLEIGFGSSMVIPLKFYLNLGEEHDVGYIRLFVSATQLPMEIIKQPPITQADRHLKEEPEIADASIWDARTIVRRLDRNIQRATYLPSNKPAGSQYGCCV